MIVTIFYLTLGFAFGTIVDTQGSTDAFQAPVSKPPKVEGKPKDEMLKVLLNLMAKLVGGETVVCTSLSNGEQVSITGSNSGKRKTFIN